MDEEWPKEGEAWMPFLIKKRRFTECMILGWQLVEDLVNQMAINEFELLYYPEGADPRVDILRDRVNFQVKLDFLKTMGRVSQSDADTIREFSKERNKLFHGYVFGSRHPVAVAEDEKTRLMELASKAARICGNRAFGVWVSEETEDAGNKEIPKPDRHPAVKRIEEFRKLRVPTMDSEDNQGDVP